MCLTFAFILGFAVCFTSYNFGALVRYKVPAMIFFACMLSIINSEFKLAKEKEQDLENQAKALSTASV